MDCLICRHGTLEDGSATVVLERGEATLIFKDVPARVCDNCGEVKLPHRVCPSCGYYRGREVIEVEENL